MNQKQPATSFGANGAFMVGSLVGAPFQANLLFNSLLNHCQVSAATV